MVVLGVNETNIIWLTLDMLKLYLLPNDFIIYYDTYIKRKPASCYFDLPLCFSISVVDRDHTMEVSSSIQDSILNVNFTIYSFKNEAFQRINQRSD